MPPLHLRLSVVEARERATRQAVTYGLALVVALSPFWVQPMQELVNAIWTNPVLLLALIPVLVVLAKVCHRCMAWCSTINLEVHEVCDNLMQPEWFCPISQNVMTDPVKACDTTVYERACWIQYCNTHKDRIKWMADNKWRLDAYGPGLEHEQATCKRYGCSSPTKTGKGYIWTDETKDARVIKAQIQVWHYSPAVVKVVWCMLWFGIFYTLNRIHSRVRSRTFDVILGSICASISLVIFHLLLRKYIIGVDASTLPTILATVTLMYLFHIKHNMDQQYARWRIVNVNISNTVHETRRELGDVIRQELSDTQRHINNEIKNEIRGRMEDLAEPIQRIESNVEHLSDRYRSLDNNVNEFRTEVDLDLCTIRNRLPPAGGMSTRSRGAANPQERGRVRMVLASASRTRALSPGSNARQ